MYLLVVIIKQFLYLKNPSLNKLARMQKIVDETDGAMPKEGYM